LLIGLLLLCGRLSCPVWWLITFEDEEIKKLAIDLYTRHKLEIDIGVATLLAKRFVREGE
jgi:hypothetical protein